MGCVACGRGLHRECRTKCSKCHPVAELVKALKPQPATEKNPVGRPLKEVSTMTDPASTGRKRAAMLYPLFPEEPCEWQGKKNCGGGTKPIIGCLEGKQQARHHGPVKETNHNNPGNVHRICTACHNQWHALNDPVYNAEEYAKLPHEPEPATEEEIKINIVWWKSAPEARELLDNVRKHSD